jgi:hypothetical protein
MLKSLKIFSFSFVTVCCYGVSVKLPLTVAGLAKVAIFTIPIAIGSDAENHFD